MLLIFTHWGKMHERSLYCMKRRAGIAAIIATPGKQRWINDTQMKK